ncbi:MAG: hypothetical protein K0M60_02350 [Hydrogenophaga sp.]|nr:hypothetical protein [Hydrogenophaga sp.]
MKEYGLVIDGRSIATEHHRPVTSPSTGTVVGLSPLASPANLDEAVAAAKRAFPA